jgi:hypothetical protein
MSVEQLLAFHDRERRVARMASSDKLVLHAEACMKAAFAWLQQERSGRLARPNRQLAEALRIIEDDSVSIGVKVRRALESRYRRQEGESDRFYGDPAEQANVVLVLIKRSVDAWQTIAKGTRKQAPSSLARQFAILGGLVKAEFPDAIRSPDAKPAIPQKSSTPVQNTALFDARLSAMEKKVDGLAREMRRLHRTGAKRSGR